jgi:hypothetical protein
MQRTGGTTRILGGHPQEGAMGLLGWGLCDRITSEMRVLSLKIISRDSR